MEHDDFPPGVLTIEEGADVTSAHLSGEIDAGILEDGPELLAALLAPGLPVVLETSGVSFIDSTGIAFLLQAARAGQTAGLPVTLPDPSDAVVRVLTLIGALEVFPVGAAADEAADPAV